VTDEPVPDEPLPRQISRLRFSPRRMVRPSDLENGGFSRLLQVGGVAALATGGAAAAAMLTGSGARKDRTSNGQENDVDLSRRTVQPAHFAGLDKPDLLRDESGPRSGSGAHVQEMTRCRSPETLIASQADLTVKRIDLKLQSGVRMADLSARTTRRMIHTWRKQNGPE